MGVVGEYATRSQVLKLLIDFIDIFERRKRKRNVNRSFICRFTHQKATIAEAGPGSWELCTVSFVGVRGLGLSSAFPGAFAGS